MNGWKDKWMEGWTNGLDVNNADPVGVDNDDDDNYSEKKTMELYIFYISQMSSYLKESKEADEY